MKQYFSRDCAIYFSITIDLLHNGSRLMQEAQRFKKQVQTHFCVKGYQYQSNIQPSWKNIPYNFLPHPWENNPFSIGLLLKKPPSPVGSCVYYLHKQLGSTLLDMDHYPPPHHPESQRLSDSASVSKVLVLQSMIHGCSKCQV